MYKSLFAVLLVGTLYGVTGHWIWGGGWLAAMGFEDFAGGTAVHALGGWAAGGCPSCVAAAFLPVFGPSWSPPLAVVRLGVLGCASVRGLLGWFAQLVVRFC